MKTIVVIFIIIGCWINEGFAFPRLDVHRGNDFYERGKYAKALEYYKKALNQAKNSDIVNFNLGAAFYKMQDYDQALKHFHQALLSENDALRQKTQYNLGNTFYQKGIAHEPTNLPFAIQSLEQGLDFYERAIALNPEDLKARHNYEFVQEEILRLKEKMQQQQQQQQQKKEQEQREQEQQETCPLTHEQSQQDSPESQPEEDGDLDQAPEKDGPGVTEEPKPQEQDLEDPADPQDQVQAPVDSNEQAQMSPEASQVPFEMSPDEAETLLEHYRRTAEPRGLLNLNPRVFTDPVLKDW